MVQLLLYGASGATQMSLRVTFLPSYVATIPSMASCRSSIWLVRFKKKKERKKEKQKRTNKPQFQRCSCSSRASYLVRIRSSLSRITGDLLN